MPACLYLLDEPHVRLEGGRLELAPSRPAQLLVYLGYRGEWVSREALAGLFWPESPEEEARHNLRVNLHRAKALPWSEGLEVERERVRLCVETDVAQFREALGRGDWQAAAKLHRRPFLQDFPLQDLPPLEDWASLERQALLEAWKSAVQRHALELEQNDQLDQSSALLAELLRHDLLAEDVLQHYLRTAYLAGQREAALKTYDRFVRELSQELGLEPMQATQELAQALRRSLPLRVSPPRPQVRIPLEVFKPPRLVGRTAEQSRLQGVQSALVSGEPGVGKTRLLLDTFPAAPLIRCREGLENVPFFPVLEYLKAHLDALPDPGPYREDLARLLPEVWPGFTPPPADPFSVKRRLLEAVHRALQGNALLLFDDLQWADESTLELLLYLHSQGQALVGAYRTHEVGPALAKTREALQAQGLEEVALAPLSPELLQTLLADLTGEAEAILDRADQAARGVAPDQEGGARAQGRSDGRVDGAPEGAEQEPAQDRHRHRRREGHRRQHVAPDEDQRRRHPQLDDGLAHPGQALRLCRTVAGFSRGFAALRLGAAAISPRLAFPG